MDDERKARLSARSGTQTLITGDAQWSASLGYEVVDGTLALTLQAAQGSQFLAADRVNGHLTALARRGNL